MALPSLDDRTYADLVAEARAMIPGLYPDWTNHNPSDPGITLIELLAWVTEQVIYRADQVPDEHYWAFLGLLAGEAPKLGDDLAAAIRASVLALREPFRAATTADYEYLALWQWPGGRRLARAQCLPRSAPDGAGAQKERQGHVTLVIVPDDPVELPAPGQELCHQLLVWLEERRLLGTTNHVVGPRYVEVTVEAEVVLRPDYAPPALKAGQRLRSGSSGGLAAAVASDLAESLRRHYHPTRGGPDGRGWPFGRPVYRSDLYQFLRGQPGVAFVNAVALASDHAPETPAGDALPLAAHELPALRPPKVTIVPAARGGPDALSRGREEAQR